MGRPRSEIPYEERMLGYRDKQKRRRDNYRSLGLCSCCGSGLDIPGRVQCSVCIGKAKEAYSRNLDRRRDYQRAYQRRLKSDMVEAYGGECLCCGETESSMLTIDHIFEDGAEERRGFMGLGSGAYRTLKKMGYPKDRYQLLCFNCNVAKYHQGVCPHSGKAIFDQKETP